MGYQRHVESMLILEFTSLTHFWQMLRIKSDPGKVAQLRTLRAFFCWRLMDVFGNVPIVTKPGEGADQSITSAGIQLH